jgi:transposase
VANKRICMSKIRKILNYHFKRGLSKREISRALKVSRYVVNQYVTDFKLSGLTLDEANELSDSVLLEKITGSKEGKNDERYKVLSDNISNWLLELKKPGVTRRLLWEEYKNKYPAGYSLSQFCYHFQVLSSYKNVYMHMDYKAGDKMFVDFTGKKLKLYNYKLKSFKDVEVFVAILASSQLTYVEAIESQKKKDFIKATENALLYFGGVPRAIVPDNLKSGVTRVSFYDPEINPEYNDFAEHYDTVILPARPYRPKDKALVENAVKITYTRIFARIRDRIFYSLEELNETIHDLLEEHNNKLFQRLDISRRELFNKVEKPELKQLPDKLYEFKEYKSLKVHFNYHIYLSCDKHYYSVPYKYAGKQVKVLHSARNVEIYYDNIRIASHRRDFNINKYSTNSEHMPSNHRFVSGWNPEKFLNWANKKGDAVRFLIEKILGSRKYPEQAYKACLGVLSMSKTYGDIRLDKACLRAIKYKNYSYRAVKNILKRGLEDEVISFPSLKKLPCHENIRGSNYYAGGENE